MGSKGVTGKVTGRDPPAGILARVVESPKDAGVARGFDYVNNGKFNLLVDECNKRVPVSRHSGPSDQRKKDID